MNFPNIMNYLDDKTTVINAGSNSKKGIHIPDVIKKSSGGFINSLRTRRHVLPKMLKCLIASKKSASSILDNPNLNKTLITDKVLKDLENYIYGLGIDSIGYTKVDRNLIFKDRVILYENAIVITMEMKSKAIETAPSPIAIKEIFRTYSELGVAVNKISDYLRSLGYNAMAGPAIGGDVNYVPLARDAGLGAIGKHGLLITDKSFGPSLRIAAVYTDIENLPLSSENNHSWINEFCKRCNKCVKACPANAIYDETYHINNKSIDFKLCGKPFANDYGCTVCIKSCTFFKGDYDNIKNAYQNTIK